MILDREHTGKTAEGIWMALFIVVPYIYWGEIYDGALLPKLLAFQTLALLLFGIGLVHAAAGRLAWRSSPLFLPLLCYLLLAAFSITQSVNRIESMLQLAQYASLALIPFLVLYTLSGDRLFRIFQVAVWAGLPIALIGLAQYFGVDIRIFGWGVYSIPSSANPSATFFHRNAAAEYLIGILPLAWIGFRLSRTPLSTAAYAALLGLLGIYLVYTRTRGAWVGLSGAVLITTGLALLSRRAGAAPKSPPHTRLKRRLLGVLAGLMILASALPENILKTGTQRFDEKKSDPITTVASIVSEQGHRGRPNLWRHTLAMVRDYPLGGVGLGNWQYIYPAYARGDQVNVHASPVRPHNDLLWIAAELGLPGLLAYLALLAVAGRLCWDLLKTSDLRIRTAALGLAVLVLAHLGDGMFNFPRERIAPALCFWFALGAIARLHADRFSAAANTPVLSLPLIAAAGLGCLLLLSGLGIGLRRLLYDRHHFPAFIAERRQDWPTAILEAERARAYGDLRANTLIILGRARYRTGDLTGAEAAYQVALRLHPNSLNAYNNLGIVYRRTRRPNRAIGAFQKALDLFPGFSEAANNLGNVYRDQGRLDEAIQAYQQAARRDLPVPQIHYNLGRAYHMKGNLLRAQENYLLALKGDPAYPPARRALISLGLSPGALPPVEKQAGGAP